MFPRQQAAMMADTEPSLGRCGEKRATTVEWTSPRHSQNNAVKY